MGTFISGRLFRNLSSNWGKGIWLISILIWSANPMQAQSVVSAGSMVNREHRMEKPDDWGSATAFVRSEDVTAVSYARKRDKTARSAISVSKEAVIRQTVGADHGWIEIGPFGGWELPLVMDPRNHKILYCGNYRSLDGGDSWQPWNLNLADVRSWTFAPSDFNVIYAVTSDRLARSGDGGLTWSYSALPPTKVYSSLDSFVVDPIDPNRICIAYQTAWNSPHNGLYAISESDDGGATWRTIKPDTFRGDFYSMHLELDPFDRDVVYASAYEDFLKTSNDGESWVGSSMLWGISFIVIDPSDNSTLYALSYNRIFVSHDGGLSWKELYPDVNGHFWSISIDPSNTSAIYLTTDVGVFKSLNGGASWTQTTLGVTTFSLLVDPYDVATLYAITSEGFYKSLDGGESWRVSNEGFHFSPVADVSVDPADSLVLYAKYGGSYPSATLTRQTGDGGLSWAAYNPPSLNMTVISVTIDPINHLVLYAGTPLGLYKSLDGGQSWHPSNGGLPAAGTVDAIAPSNTLVLYSAVPYSGLFKSTDGGETWNHADAGLPSGVLNKVVVDPLREQTAYVITPYNGIFQSTDGGTSWIGIESQGQENDLAIDPANPQILYVGKGDRYTTGGILKSVDQGKNWTPMNQGLPDSSYVTSVLIVPGSPSMTYAGTPNGLYKSDNGGASWSFAGFSLGVSKVKYGPADQSLFVIDSDGALYKLSTCNCLITPPSGEIPVAGGSGTVQISLGAECTWKAESTADWIELDSPVQGRGDGDLNFHAASNPGALRHGSIIINRQTVDIVQAGSLCTYSLNPVRARYTTEGGTGGINVAALGVCNWTVESRDPWITIEAGGNGGGMAGYHVAANQGPPRAGIIMVAGLIFTIQQQGKICQSRITLDKTSFNPAGGTGTAQVTSLTDCDWFAFSNAAWITITSGSSSSEGGLVAFSVAPNHGAARRGTLEIAGQTFTIIQGGAKALFIPVVLSVHGMAGSFFSTELTLANLNILPLKMIMTYTASIGPGSGVVTAMLPPGQQIIPDAIKYLMEHGMPIPSLENQVGTLGVRLESETETPQANILARTTTLVRDSSGTILGRAGLAYPALGEEQALNGPVIIGGLRQNETDRSNVAFQNAGTSDQGAITLQITVYDGESSFSKVFPAVQLQPGGFQQISGILSSGGLSLKNGYVRVEKTSGTAPFYAYGVINDQTSSDGSFLLPQPITASPVTGLVLPVLVQANQFHSELAVTNWSTLSRQLECTFVADGVTTRDKTARFTLNLTAGQQLLIPNIFDYLRSLNVDGIGGADTMLAGALFVASSDGDVSAVTLAARTSSVSTFGKFGVFYPAIPYGATSTNEAWLYGLQQNSENRSNLALVNTGERDATADTFEIFLYDGRNGQMVNWLPISVEAHRWTQINLILTRYAPGVTEGYAHITRAQGENPFIAYAVVNDGAQPGERSGDGAFISSAP